MAVELIRCIFVLLGFLFSGTFAKGSEDGTHHPVFHLQISNLNHQIKNDKSIVHPRMIVQDPLEAIPQRDVITPMTTVPTINPMTPTTTNPTYNPYGTNPVTTPTNSATNPVTTPTSPSSSTGQSWCTASPSASQTALQVALDYACGYGGADCSAIQQGGSCFNPDTVRDHASYAFNSYYKKNPVPTSCDFSGTAIITNTDPSTSTCKFPSSSTSSSTLNTDNPTGSTVFGGTSPPVYTDTTSSSTKTSPTLLCFLLLFIYFKVYK